MKQYKYKKIITDITTYTLVEPDYELLKLKERVQVIGELDGFTYVSVPDSVTLPTEQPVLLIEANLESDKIDFQTVQKIRARYSVNDEIKMLRTAPSTETTAWNGYVEQCRADGAAAKELLLKPVEVEKL
jgi:hypothetical protein